MASRLTFQKVAQGDLVMADDLRGAIRTAYEEARAQALGEDPPEMLPAWEQLPLAMRIAFIHVYGAGRRLGAKEAREGDLPATFA
jgi:hypothetical protein